MSKETLPNHIMGLGVGMVAVAGPFSHLHLFFFIKIWESRYVTNYTGYIFLQLEDVKNVYENNLGEYFDIWRTTQVKQ